MFNVSGGRIEVANVFDDLVPRSNFASCSGQSIQQPAPVSFRHDARIGDHDHATVGAAANEAAETLLETQRRMRQHVFDERVAATRDDRFAVCGSHRFCRNAKWQLGEHQSAERLARYVDAFPEGGGTEEDGPAGLTEAGEQCISSILAMHEQWPATLGAAGAELDRKSTRLNSSHLVISYAVFC